MVICLYAGEGVGIAYLWSGNIALQEHWAYSAGGHGHARRHESVWAVPGTLADRDEPVMVNGRRVATIYRGDEEAYDELWGASLGLCPMPE